MEASWGIPVIGVYEVLNVGYGFGALITYLCKDDLAFQGSFECYEDSTEYSPTKRTTGTSEQSPVDHLIQPPIEQLPNQASRMLPLAF